MFSSPLPSPLLGEKQLPLIAEKKQFTVIAKRELVTLE